jgi:hypothetical protein
VLQVIELVRAVDQAVDSSEQYGAAGDSAALNTHVKTNGMCAPALSFAWRARTASSPPLSRGMPGNAADGRPRRRAARALRGAAPPRGG